MMVATWDAYGPPEGNAIDSNGADSMCVVTEKKEAVAEIDMIVTANKFRYDETGYKELERLTHETYIQGLYR